MREQIKKYIADSVGFPAVQLTDRLAEDLGMDSLELTQLVLDFEDLYCVAIPDDELFFIKTVDDVCQAVERHVRV